MLSALRQIEHIEPESDDMQFRDHSAVQGKRDFYPIDPRKLKIDLDYNVRSMDSKETREHIAALKASIIANGVKVPLEVRLAPDDKIYIVAGHCRHAAVMEAIRDGHPIETVPCIPEGKGTSEIDRVVNLIVSNSGKPLAPLEVAAVVKRLDGFGWSTKQIAERLGWKSSASVKQHLDMLAMPEAVKDHVRKGDISATTARNIARGVDPEEAEKLIKANLEENARIKGKPTRVTPKTIKRDKPKPPAPAEREAPDDLGPAPGMHTLPPEPQTQVTDDRTAAETMPDQALIESTREKVAEQNGWHPEIDAPAPAPQSQGIKDLIDALAPFAALAADHDLESKDDADLLEVSVSDVKRAYRAHTIATGGE
jgi:ParB family chromosome partitioning protein